MSFTTGIDIGDVSVDLATAEYRGAFLPKTYFTALDIGDCPEPFTISFSSANYAKVAIGVFGDSVDIGDCPLPFTIEFGPQCISNITKVYYGSIRTIISSIPSEDGDTGQEIVFGLLLIADFDASQFRGGAPLSVIFEDLSYTSHAYEDVTEINQWSWDFDDGSYSTEQNPTHIFTIMGEYNVTLTITTTDGRTASVTKRIIVAYIMSYRVAVDDSSLAGFFEDDFKQESWPQAFEWNTKGTVVDNSDEIPAFSPEVFE